MALTCTVYGKVLPLHCVSLSSAKLSIFRPTDNNKNYLKTKAIWFTRRPKLTATSESRLAE